MPEVAVPNIFSRTLTDPDELESMFNRHRAFHVVQLDLQPLQCQLLSLKLDGAEFAFRKISSPLRIWGDKNPDFLVFEFLMSPLPGELISHGRPVQPNTLYGFDSTRGIDMVLPANVMIGSLLIQRHIFEDCLQVMDRGDLDERFLATNIVQDPAPFAPVRCYLSELYSLVQRRTAFLDQAQVSQLILDDYLPLLIDAIPPADLKLPDCNRPRCRAQLVQQAEDYMLANLDQPITLKDLCKILNTSRSPLNYGFQEVFGISPMAYLKRLRLCAVHKALKTAIPDSSSVTAIAHRFGFWHAGRFSQEYKQMFGSLPSATLNQGSVTDKDCA